MRLLKQTIEYRADTEEEAKNIMENIREKANNSGYTISASGFIKKEKKLKGEIIDEAYIVKIIETFGGIWEE